MRIPTICGTIDRRILANYRIDPEAMARVLPTPFRPKLVAGFGIGGICLIRLKNIRPRFVPLPWGVRSENAAHRFAVEWESDGKTHSGVYIPRRDTSLRLNALAGGRLFPGEHHLARFEVEETASDFSVVMQSYDQKAHVEVAGTIVATLPAGSVFSSVAEASRFFEEGSLGYSDTSVAGTFDGLELRCENWAVTPLEVRHVVSSYFGDQSIFPAGSAVFDHALLMQDIAHEWLGQPDLCCAAT